MAAISINDVTTTLTDGSGVFDVLMRAMDAHLDKQYTAGRIKGADYATVYLGALQAVLQQSITFVLSEQKAEKEVDLITAQITGADKDNLIKDSQKLSIDSDRTIKEAQSAKDLLVKQEQIDASQAATAVKQQLANVQDDVYIKQAAQFDDNHKLNVIKTMIDLRTTGLTQGIAGIEDVAGDTFLKSLLADVGIVYASDILVPV